MLTPRHRSEGPHQPPGIAVSESLWGHCLAIAMDGETCQLDINFSLAPEILRYRTCQLVKPPNDTLNSPQLCHTTFWVALPEPSSFKVLATSRIFAEDLSQALDNLQFGLCPRSALLLTTFGMSIYNVQNIGLGHHRMDLDFLSSLSELWSNQVPTFGTVTTLITF